MSLLIPALLLACCGIAAGQTAKAPKAGAAQAAPFRWVAPLADAAWAKKILPPTVRHATFKSPSMGAEVGYYIYLPPGYDSAEERYPVVYHLHGGRPGAENKGVRLAAYVDAAIKEGAIKPTIYVFPNGGIVSHYDYRKLVRHARNPPRHG